MYNCEPIDKWDGYSVAAHIAVIKDGHLHTANILCIYSKEFDALQISYVQDVVNQKNCSINQESA